MAIIPLIRALAIMAVCLTNMKALDNEKPRLNERTAREDYESSSVVVLGRVITAKEKLPTVGSSGWWQIEIKIQVLHVVKGPSLQELCFIYLYPNPTFAYEGPPRVWVSTGQEGIFMLERRNGCFRAISDRRPFLPVNGLPVHPSQSPMTLIAEMTLPVNRNCLQYPSQIGTEVDLITSSLVGPRRAKELLEALANNASGPVKTCSCLALALTWSFKEPCLDSIRVGNEREQEVLRLLKKEQRENASIKIALWNEQPSASLKDIVGFSGLDGAILDLRGSAQSYGFHVSPRVCRAFRRELLSGELTRPAARGTVPLSPREVEAKALRAFRVWLDRGCSGLP